MTSILKNFKKILINNNNNNSHNIKFREVVLAMKVEEEVLVILQILLNHSILNLCAIYLPIYHLLLIKRVVVHQW